MKHIAYAETVFGTDDRLADLVLEYARLLARHGTADTVTVPGLLSTGEIEPVSMLVGPASQITAWADPAPFEGDAAPAIAELERRIHGLDVGTEPFQDGEPHGVEDLDDLD